MPKPKLIPTDGLGPKEIKQLRSAIRQVWQRSYARRLVKKRCTREDGFTYCEQCNTCCPDLKIDHIVACGELNNGYIDRMFVPSSQLQGLCRKCHNEKTKKERAISRKKVK